MNYKPEKLKVGDKLFNEISKGKGEVIELFSEKIKIKWEDYYDFSGFFCNYWYFERSGWERLKLIKKADKEIICRNKK